MKTRREEQWISGHTRGNAPDGYPVSFDPSSGVGAMSKRRTILQHSTLVTDSGSLLRLDDMRFVDKVTRMRWREISKARK